MKKLSLIVLLVALLLPVTVARAQHQTPARMQQAPGDSTESLLTHLDSLEMATVLEEGAQQEDSIAPVKRKRDWSTWRPNAKRAMWLAIVIPGAGQVYNRKYWKLPLVYGGFVGCAYAMRWNNMMYHDYAQAYMDMMDNDPNTHSYDQFLHLGNQINSSNMERYQELFRKRKDRYRRWRDLSFFVMVGVYALSIVDAYVDASLSEFDISKDLSMSIAPAVLGNGLDHNPVKGAAIGLQCSINF